MFDFFDYGATSSIEYKDVDAARLKLQQYFETKDNLKKWPTGYTMSLYEFVTYLKPPSAAQLYYQTAIEADRLTKLKNSDGVLVFGEPPNYTKFQNYMLSAVQASESASQREQDAGLLEVLAKTYDKSVTDIKDAVDPRKNLYALGAVVLVGLFVASRLK